MVTYCPSNFSVVHINNAAHATLQSLRFASLALAASVAFAAYLLPYFSCVACVKTVRNGLALRALRALRWMDGNYDLDAEQMSLIIHN